MLFQNNKSFNVFPLKAVYMETTEALTFPIQAMFVVPKRNFKKAHDRNQLKRRMREAYRINKHRFYTSLLLENRKMIVAFIYTGKKAELYNVIESAVLKLSEKIVRPIKK